MEGESLRLDKHKIPGKQSYLAIATETKFNPHNHVLRPKIVQWWPEARERQRGRVLGAAAGDM